MVLVWFAKMVLFTLLTTSTQLLRQHEQDTGCRQATWLGESARSCPVSDNTCSELSLTSLYCRQVSESNQFDRWTVIYSARGWPVLKTRAKSVSRIEKQLQLFSVFRCVGLTQIDIRFVLT